MREVEIVSVPLVSVGVGGVSVVNDEIGDVPLSCFVQRLSPSQFALCVASPAVASPFLALWPAEASHVGTVKQQPCGL